MKKSTITTSKSSLVRIIIAILIATGLLALGGCNNKYNYPDGLTNEYFYTNYMQMDYNYMFSGIYENSASENPYGTNPGNYWFYAIHNVSIDDYLACKYWFGGIGATSQYMVYANAESNPDLIGTYGIIQVSVILKSGMDSDEITSYEKSTLASKLSTTEDKSICNLLQQNISNKDGYVKPERFTSGEPGPGEYLYCADEKYLNTLLYMRLYTPATASIFWESNIVLHEGRYCLASYSDKYRNHHYLIPLSDEVSDYIRNVVEQSGHSFVYERIEQ